MKKEKSKQLTMDELIKYNQEVLIPAIELGIEKKIENLATKDELKLLATKDELKALENKFDEFKSETLTGFDKVLTKLDILIEDKDIRNYQDEQKRKFFGIVANHLETGKTTPDQLAEISKLNAL